MCGRSPPRVLLAVFNVLPLFHSLTASHLLLIHQYESGSTPLHGIRQQTGVKPPIILRTGQVLPC